MKFDEYISKIAGIILHLQILWEVDKLRQDLENVMNKVKFVDVTHETTYRNFRNSTCDCENQIDWKKGSGFKIMEISQLANICSHQSTLKCLLCECWKAIMQSDVTNDV